MYKPRADEQVTVFWQMIDLEKKKKKKRTEAKYYKGDRVKKIASVNNWAGQVCLYAGEPKGKFWEKDPTTTTKKHEWSFLMPF